MINKPPNKICKKLYNAAKLLNETCQQIIDSGIKVNEADFKFVYEYIVNTVLPDDDEPATYDWLEQLFPEKGRDIDNECWYSDGFILDFYPMINNKQESLVTLHGACMVFYKGPLTRGYVRQCIKMFHLRVK